MKKFTFKIVVALSLIGIVLTFSCGAPVTLTGWKNPKENFQIKRLVVWAMFNKLEYQKPFENAIVSLFGKRGLNAVGSLSLLEPGKKYDQDELEKIFNDAGADAILIFNYTGTKTEEDYVPQTTTYYPAYYGSYYGYYSWGWNAYYGGGNPVTTGGYWTSTNIVNLTSNLYGNADNALAWTGSISVTDPEYVDQVGYNVARYIYSEWVKEGFVTK